MRILVVEDEKPISDLIGLNLAMAGYKYSQIFTGGKVLEEIKKNKYDLILLDVMLPEKDGWTVLEEIKEYNIPVIFLTAKDSILEKVNGLKLGAEDYITKPFQGIELIARIQVVLRRYLKDDNRRIKINNLIIDEEKHEVSIKNETVDLTIKEYELLLALYRGKNKAISREKLLELVWGYEFFGETRTVDIHIQRLRKKVGNNVKIVTVYKYGYRLELD